jgi:twitching motility protein PilT
VPRLDSFLRLVAEQQASDLHFHSGKVPVIRHDGDLMPIPFRILTESESWRFIREILTDKQAAALETENELDFMYELPGTGRFRANVFRQQGGWGAVFRIIPFTIPAIDDLMLPPSVRKLCSLGNGLVLVTGPTGSGKTTTLAAIVNEINQTTPRHIITIEDPIEFVHPSATSVVTQRQVGEHAESFASALRSAVREAPDVVVVGEMRDLETITLALSAAETGSLVFGTLHTSSAAKSIDRIIDMLPDDSRDQMRGVLSVMLKGVLAQNLCKRADGEGRIALHELLLNNYAVSNMIREGKLHQIESYLHQASNDPTTGMQSLDSCIVRYVKEGLVTVDDALPFAAFPDHIRKIAAQVGAE